MRLIGKLTPKLSLYGTISKTADVIGSNIQPLRVEENGVYEVFDDINGFNPVYVNTPEPKEEQTKTLNVAQNGFYEVLPDKEKVLSSAKINVNVPPKEEQEKVVDITENGTTEVLPDENKVLGKVTVNVDVPSSGTEEIETLIDNSGVLDSTEGTATEKVEQLIGKGEQIRLWDKVVFKEMALSNKNSPFMCFAEKTIPKMDFSQVTNLVYTFSSASIEYIDYYINSEKVINFSSCFSTCRNLVHLVGVDTSSAINLADMFLNCSKLETITEPFNVSNATNLNKAFNGCVALKKIRFVENTINVSIAFNSAYLSTDSIDSIIGGLATVTTAQTLTLHADVKAKLTQTQLDTISGKNWNLA